MLRCPQRLRHAACVLRSFLRGWAIAVKELTTFRVRHAQLTTRASARSRRATLEGYFSYWASHCHELATWRTRHSQMQSRAEGAWRDRARALLSGSKLLS